MITMMTAIKLMIGPLASLIFIIIILMMITMMAMLRMIAMITVMAMIGSLASLHNTAQAASLPHSCIVIVIIIISILVIIIINMCFYIMCFIPNMASKWQASTIYIIIHWDLSSTSVPTLKLP